MNDENKQVVLLLSAYFTRVKKGDSTPLTPAEYGRFARWLKENKFQPQDLFHQFEEISRRWVDPKGKITAERLQFLLGRGMAMGLALEKWQNAGIWVITRSDTTYPKRLKKHLGANAPAILFGVGNQQLLNTGGLSIVGSRNIDDEDRKYTAMIARQAAFEGLNVVSGGARGVDETAMTAALEVDGTCLGILANDLFKAAVAGKWRKYIRSNQLALISPFYPEASFQVGNAMGRNKYIYCLSDYALVVRAEEGQGGTWAGAKENSKAHWVRLFVKAQSDASGNLALLKQGALPIEIVSDREAWLLPSLRREVRVDEKELGIAQQGVKESSSSKLASLAPVLAHPKNSYQGFLKLLRRLIGEHRQVTLALLKEARKDLTQKQISEWLNKASDDGLIEQQGKNRIYRLKASGRQQPDLFS